MNDNQKELFQIAQNFLGWGDPNGGIWFVGIEEAANWNQNNIHELKLLRDRHYISETKFDWKELGAAGRGVRDYMSKICYGFSERYKTKSWQEFRDQNLWAEQSQVFQTNLFPLGKASLQTWPSHYKELFGFGIEDKQVYYNAVIQGRVPVIRKYWESYSPQATIAFGKSYWDEFRVLFNIETSDLEQLSEDVFYYPRGKVILCPFLGQGMSDSKVQVIVTQLEQWKISIN